MGLHGVVSDDEGEDRYERDLVNASEHAEDLYWSEDESWGGQGGAGVPLVIDGGKSCPLEVGIIPLAPPPLLLANIHGLMLTSQN